jgi:hypothetical protein
MNARNERTWQNARRARGAMLLTVLAALLSAGALPACEGEDETTAVVDNAYPIDPTASITVYKVWWQVTLFSDPVGPGQSSRELRAAPATDYAYALLAPGWDPESPSPPKRLWLARSAFPLSVNRGRTLHVTVSDEFFVGDCHGTRRLAQADADFIAERIFPDEAAGRRYDATACAFVGDATDAGGEQADGGDALDAGSD